MKTPFKKKFRPLGLKRIYFDTKGGIQTMEVLKETKDGTVVCWEPQGEVPVPFKRADFQREAGGYWASEAEAAASAVRRLKVFIKECEKEIVKFSKLS